MDYTAATRMHCASIQWEDTAAPASQDTWGMAPSAEVRAPALISP